MVIITLKKIDIEIDMPYISTTKSLIKSDK